MDPFEEALRMFLLNPLVSICKSYHNFALCNNCLTYHMEQFCPQQCLSLSRYFPLTIKFNSHLFSCHCNFARRKSAPLVFQDPIDNELWNWILCSIRDQWPDREYQILSHDLDRCLTSTEPAVLVIETRHFFNRDKIQPKKIPPSMTLYFKQDWIYHMGFKSLRCRLQSGDS